MAKAIFQAKLNLVNVAPLNVAATEWSVDARFTDNDGAFTGLDITVGDVLAVDTSGAEAGSFTLFEVFSIITPGYTDVTVWVRYSSVNDNLYGAPDLSAFIFNDCTITRPSPNLGLLPVVSRDLQIVSDKFTEYVQNYNFVKIVDNLQAGNRTFDKINGEPSSMLKGMAVYIPIASSSECKLAIATTSPQAHVVGLIADAVVSTGILGSISSKGMIEKAESDWDLLTGETGGLQGGKDYFLRADVAGGITNAPPVNVNQFVVKIGKAISSTLLDLNIETPIEL